MSSELQAVLDFQVELVKFYNVDLFQRGNYQLRLSFKLSSKITHKVDVTQIRNNGNQPMSPHVIGGSVAVSKTFQILYRKEDVEIDDVFMFKVYMMADIFRMQQSLNDADFQLTVELWFTEEDVRPETVFQCVSSRVLRLHMHSDQSLHHHIPLQFDYFHLSAVSITIHASLLALHLSYISLSNQLSGSKTSLARSDPAEYARSGKANRRIQNAFERHRRMCRILLSVYESLQTSYEALIPHLPNHRHLALEHIDCLTRFEEMVAKCQRYTLIEEEDMVQAMQSDIATLCGQNVLLWMQFLELITLSQKVNYYLAKEHHTARVKRFAEGFFVNEFRKQEMIACYDNSIHGHADIASVVRSSRYYQLLPALSVECVELDGEASTLPIIFEDVYIEQTPAVLTSSEFSRSDLTRHPLRRSSPATTKVKRGHRHSVCSTDSTQSETSSLPGGRNKAGKMKFIKNVRPESFRRPSSMINQQAMIEGQVATDEKDCTLVGYRRVDELSHTLTKPVELGTLSSPVSDEPFDATDSDQNRTVPGCGLIMPSSVLYNAVSLPTLCSAESKSECAVTVSLPSTGSMPALAVDDNDKLKQCWRDGEISHHISTSADAIVAEIEPMGVPLDAVDITLCESTESGVLGCAHDTTVIFSNDSNDENSSEIASKHSSADEIVACHSDSGLSKTAEDIYSFDKSSSDNIPNDDSNTIQMESDSSAFADVTNSFVGEHSSSITADFQDLSDTACSSLPNNHGQTEQPAWVMASYDDVTYSSSIVPDVVSESHLDQVSDVQHDTVSQSSSHSQQSCVVCESAPGGNSPKANTNDEAVENFVDNTDDKQNNCSYRNAARTAERSDVNSNDHIVDEVDVGNGRQNTQKQFVDSEQYLGGQCTLLELIKEENERAKRKAELISVGERYSNNSRAVFGHEPSPARQPEQVSSSDGLVSRFDDISSGVVDLTFGPKHDVPERMARKLVQVVKDETVKFISAKELLRKQLEQVYGGHFYSDFSTQSSIWPYFSSSVAIPRSVPGSSPDDGIHLVICVHGLDGNSTDLRLVRTYLELALPGGRIDFLMSERNQTDTFADFEVMTDRLVQEILYHIDLYGIQPTRISFIGHSLGNLIIRSAMSRPKMAELLPRLHTFLSLSGPHLGTLFNNSGLVNMGMWFMQKWKKSGSLLQLSMKDHSDPRQTFLYKLSQKTGLEFFRNILLVGSQQDRYVPYHSSRIELCKSALKDSSGLGAVYVEMVNNILQPIIYKSDINFVRYDVFHALPSNATNNLIGRAAHIAVLDSELFIEKFVTVAVIKYFV